MRLTAFVFLALASAPLAAQRPADLAPNAPKDQPMIAHARCQWDAAIKAMEPYVAKARASYPAAKARFQKGLPPRHTFFITTRLRDQRGAVEQVFIAVDSIVQDRISGRISSDISLVLGYARGQPYSFREADLVDWMIARPDGTEEGNIVGVFLDSYKPPDCTDAGLAVGG
jgi:hypothetical protein